MTTREQNLKTAALWQISAARDAATAVKFLADAQKCRGARRADRLSDAAAFQLLAAEAHKRAVALIAA